MPLSAARQLFADIWTVAACTAVDNSAPGAALTCSSDTDSQTNACNAGFYLVDGMADTCSDCVAVANSATGATLTCSSATDSQTTGCDTGYFLTDGVLGGATDTCTEMTCTGTDSSGTDASCGSNSACSEGGTGDGYTCTCDTGFYGTTTTNGVTLCTGMQMGPLLPISASHAPVCNSEFWCTCI